MRLAIELACNTEIRAQPINYHHPAYLCVTGIGCCGMGLVPIRRMKPPAPTCCDPTVPACGHIFWIFGLSGAGKSTLAQALVAELRRRQMPVLALDGDDLRNGLCRDLGFSENDRTENIRRAAAVARLGIESHLCVVASFITPLASQRRMIKDILGADRVSLIFADAPLAVCRQRDSKGLYAKAVAGQVLQMTGLTSAFEAPEQVDLALSTGAVLPALSIQALLEFAFGRLR